MQTRVVSLTGGGVSLHPRVRYFSTSGGNTRGNGGNGARGGGVMDDATVGREEPARLWTYQSCCTL